MRRRKKQQQTVVMVVAAVCLFAVGAWLIFAHSKTTSSVQVPTNAVAWPSFGESAVGVVGSDSVETHNAQTPMPTASTAKLITALVVLQKKPLTTGETGPLITMSRNDIALLNEYTAQGGSEIGRVLIGERLSEYQMLEAMMLPSANNMADSLAIWAYGSLPAYRDAANKYLASRGLRDTHVGVDASGLDPSTVSTAHDMVRIGELAMQNPVLAEIVAKPSVSGFPLMGTIKNVNTLLGHSGVVGIKTGNSDQQSGAFVGAAKVTVNGKTEIVVTALYGAPSLGDAMSASLSLLKSVEAGLK